MKHQCVFNIINIIVLSFAEYTCAQRDRSRITPIRGRSIMHCTVKERLGGR
jgi:hypothetical protein